MMSGKHYQDLEIKNVVACIRGGARQEIAFDAIPFRGEGRAFDA